MRLEDLPPFLRLAIENAGLAEFLDRNYTICRVNESGDSNPYFMPSTIVGGRSSANDPRLNPLSPPQITGDGRELIDFWRIATGGMDPHALRPRITGRVILSFPTLARLAQNVRSSGEMSWRE